MMMHRKNQYNFSDKIHSKMGILSSILSLISFCILSVALVNSVLTGGNLTYLYGFFCILAWIAAIWGGVFAISSFREENTKMTFKYAGSVFSVILILTCIGIYILGYFN